MSDVVNSMRFEKRCFLAKRNVFKVVSPIFDQILLLKDECKSIADAADLNPVYVWEFAKEVMDLDMLDVMDAEEEEDEEGDSEEEESDEEADEESEED